MCVIFQTASLFSFILPSVLLKNSAKHISVLFIELLCNKVRSSLDGDSNDCFDSEPLYSACGYVYRFGFGFQVRLQASQLDPVTLGTWMLFKSCYLNIVISYMESKHCDIIYGVEQKIVNDVSGIFT